MPEVSSVDGIKIYYEVIGEGDFSMVFIGGWGARTGRKTWRYQLSLAEKYKIILIDLAGHGNSGKNREKYTMELYGHDVKSVIEELDLGEVILIGWSMGGAAILEAANLLKDRVIGLIPVDALFPDQESPYTGLDEEAIQNNLKPYEEDFAKAYLNLLNSFISDKFDPEDVKEWHKYAKTLDKRSMISALREMMLWNVHDILPKIKKPIKSILASKTMEHFSTEEYRKNIDFEILEDTGHLLAMEDPKQFNSILEQTIVELTHN